MARQEAMHEQLKRFYFTYGSSEQFPFQHGWTEILAPSREVAEAVFKAYHPNRPGSSALNCAWVYDEERFKETCMWKERGSRDNICHEVIGPLYTYGGRTSCYKGG